CGAGPDRPQQGHGEVRRGTAGAGTQAAGPGAVGGEPGHPGDRRRRSGPAGPARGLLGTPARHRAAEEGVRPGLERLSMSLRALLADVDPGWLDDAGGALDADLAERARGSALGRRLLAGWLAAGPAAALLAPDPVRAPGGIRERWPRARLGALCRDLGILAHAPPIRAEIRREPVRR